VAAGSGSAPLEKIVGQEAEPILGLVPVPLEEDVVEDLPAVEVGGDEDRNAEEGPRRPPETA